MLQTEHFWSSCWALPVINALQACRWQAGKKDVSLLCKAAFPMTAEILHAVCKKKKKIEKEWWIRKVYAAFGPGCHSPVSGQLLLPSLLFIKPWQSSYNFSLLLMENESVEFMILLLDACSFDRGHSLKFSSSQSHFLKFLFHFFLSQCVLSGHGQWVDTSAFDLP